MLVVHGVVPVTCYDTRTGHGPRFPDDVLGAERRAVIGPVDVRGDGSSQRGVLGIVEMFGDLYRGIIRAAGVACR